VVRLGHAMRATSPADMTRSLERRKFLQRAAIAAGIVVGGGVAGEEILTSISARTNNLTTSGPLVPIPEFAKAHITRLAPGKESGQYLVSQVPDGEFFNAQGVTFTGYPSIGANKAPVALSGTGDCWAWQSGQVIGQQSRDLTWYDMHDVLGGSGFRVQGTNVHIDRVFLDNMEDAFNFPGYGAAPYEGDGFVVSNCYVTYNRDDFIQNDGILAGHVFDCLVDGTFTGISERPDTGSAQESFPAPAGEQIILDSLLLRLHAMPGPFVAPRVQGDPTVLGHGELFKWDWAHPGVSNQPVINNCIFYVEQAPNNHGTPTGTCNFPANTEVHGTNTVVWTGGGEFPGYVPAGVAVTSDSTIWDLARADWLGRHSLVSSP
jgi:hypothetical protein